MELKIRGVLNEDEFDAIKNDTLRQNIGNTHRDMVDGSGIWSTIGHRIVDLVKRKFLNAGHDAVDLAKRKLGSVGTRFLDRAGTSAEKKLRLYWGKMSVKLL